MLRTSLAILAVILPIFAGLGLLYFFMAGTIGTATTMAGCFSLAAIAVTAVALHGDGEDAEADGVASSRLRL